MKVKMPSFKINFKKHISDNKAVSGADLNKLSAEEQLYRRYQEHIAENKRIKVEITNPHAIKHAELALFHFESELEMLSKYDYNSRNEIRADVLYILETKLAEAGLIRSYQKINGISIVNLISKPLFKEFKISCASRLKEKFVPRLIEIISPRIKPGKNAPIGYTTKNLKSQIEHSIKVQLECIENYDTSNMDEVEARFKQDLSFTDGFSINKRLNIAIFKEVKKYYEDYITLLTKEFKRHNNSLRKENDILGNTVSRIGMNISVLDSVIKEM